MSDGQPLAGLRVLDFSQNLPGPYASFILASLGAEVIKVEPPRGDPGRHIGPFFDLVNRGKKSVVLDLRDPSNAAALEALVISSDILLEGFRPGVMARLGCDAETARRWKPSLVYCSISAFGQSGPRRGEAGHDLNLQALTGVCHLERDPSGAPRGSVLPVADLSSSLVAVAAICAAVAKGDGATLDVAMADAALSWAHVWGHGIDLGAPVRQAQSRGGGRGLLAGLLGRTWLAGLDREKLYSMPHYGVYRCRGGQYLALGIVDEAHFWRALCDVVGLRFCASMSLPMRVAAGPILRRILSLRFRTRTRDAWMEALVAADVPASPCLTPEEAVSEDQFQARDLYGARGQVRAPLPGARHLDGEAPALGEHTAEVLGAL